VRLAKMQGAKLRQSSARVGKLALVKHQRYAHAHQFKRANKALRKLKTYVGRVIRDIARRTADREELKQAFAMPLSLAWRVLEQERMRRRSNASARAKPTILTSSTSRSVWQRR
jgi:transposase, IS5 family